MKGYTHIAAEPFPVHKLTRVDHPTTKISADRIQRPREREAGFVRAALGEYGPVLQKEMHLGRFVRKHPISGSQSWMMRNMIPLIDGKIAATKAPLPDDPGTLTRHIKEAAYFLRADAVGVCELPPYAVYTHKFGFGQGGPGSEDKPIELKHRYAIALLIDQDWRTANAFTGSDWISNAMSMLAYSNSGFIAIILAEYIRSLGYPAKAHYASHYELMVPPILLWAGLGEMSRIGDCVVNPFLGPRFKAAVVTTDLPLVPDKPIDFGLQDFCSKCKKCARECPSGAISDGGKEMHNGYEKWPVEVKKCTSMRVGNQKGAGCGTCVKVCPWNKPYTPFHRVVGWAMRHSGIARNLAIWGDDFMGYGRPHYEDKWWLDLVDAKDDGVLVVPEKEARRDNAF
jgi:3-chloro-4-hydroxyphenylacetate reductive dehalogenase